MKLPIQSTGTLSRTSFAASIRTGLVPAQVMRPLARRIGLGGGPVISTGSILDGGGRLGFECGRLACSCSGDSDCNDMFGSRVCGDIAACYEDGRGGVRCECLRF